MSHNTQFTQELRYQISAYKKAGFNQTRIASFVGVHPSTIGRELRRKHGQRGYRPKQAQQFSQKRCRDKPRKRIEAETWDLVESRLRVEWSPEQITSWLYKYRYATVSHERIYQYILAGKKAGGNLYIYLRCQKQRKKRYGAKDRRGQISDRQSIDSRPVIVDNI